VTATLPRTHIDTEAPSQPAQVAVVTRWHELRRIAGLVALVLAVVSGVILQWPAMVIVGVLGGGIALDATLALSSQRAGVGPTLVADISFTAIGLIAAAVPPPAVGIVVAYFVLVVAVLGISPKSWALGLYAVTAGTAVAFLAPLVDTADGSVVRSLASGVIVVAVFGILTIAMVREFAMVRQRGNETVGRRIEVADSVARASRALVAEDDASALGSALEAVREAMGVSAVFVERNVEDATMGLAAVVVDRASADHVAHPSLELRSTVPWSAMPGARAHLEGGAPFFYRVEEARGTQADRSGDGGLRVEVNVPISLHGDWVGVIGAADADPDRVWRTDDLVLLRTMADLTAAFWQRANESKVRDSLIGTLDGRLRYEEAIARASRALLGEHASDLQPALVAVGEASGIDELYVTRTVEAPDGSPSATVIATWTGPGVDPFHGLDSTSPYADDITLRERLQRGEMAEPAVDGAMQLVAGIEVAGAWFGSVGFVASGRMRPWSDRDVAFLRTFADILGAFYERAQNRARLEDSLSSKDQLIASVSHELRTPLTAVGGLAEELRFAGDTLDASERDQLLGVIADESHEMADLVEDLLVAARSDDGTIPVFPERIDLALLTESVVGHLAVPESSTVTIADAPSVAYADPVRVRQVIRNLLTNAFRYGGSTITASYGVVDGFAHVDIHDDGPGIPVEDHDAVFEAYGRSRSGATVKASVGLGLTLSRRLARLMDGDLGLVDGEGIGCTFRLTLPLPTPDDR
jgi:signal transduction histidine kinase